MRFKFTAASIRDPWESATMAIRIEPAPDCYGEVCNSSVHAPDGELEPLRPHFHVIVSGQEPDAGPRYHAIGVFDSD